VPPTEEFKTPDGMTHRLWMLHKKEPILKIHEAMKPMRLFIADGHHRYETALKYRDEMREMTGRRDGRQPYDFVLMYLQRAEDESLLTAPFHRVLARELGLDTNMDEVIEDLEEYFHVAEFKLNMKDLDKAAATVSDKVKRQSQAKTRYVMALPNGRAWQLSLKKDANLDEMIEEETMSPTSRRWTRSSCTTSSSRADGSAIPTWNSTRTTSSTARSARGAGPATAAQGMRGVLHEPGREGEVSWPSRRMASCCRTIP
jgi:hypothetical protein